MRLYRNKQVIVKGKNLVKSKPRCFFRPSSRLHPRKPNKPSQALKNAAAKAKQVHKQFFKIPHKTLPELMAEMNANDCSVVTADLKIYPCRPKPIYSVKQAMLRNLSENFDFIGPVHALGLALRFRVPSNPNDVADVAPKGIDPVAPKHARKFALHGPDASL